MKFIDKSRIYVFAEPEIAKEIKRQALEADLSISNFLIIAAQEKIERLTKSGA